MIRELSVTSLALIDSLRLEFKDGFTVLTGETGAGKSILMEAIGLLLGERASSDAIRSGCDEAHVHGIFELDPVAEDLAQVCAAAAIPLDDGVLIIRRTLTRTGRNRIFVNQVPVPLTTLKSIGDHLVDLHGQHEHQSLLNTDAPASLIDRQPAVAPVRKTFDDLFARREEARSELERFDHDLAAGIARRDLLEFQLQELKALQLQPDEEQTLESEYALLSSSTQRMQCAARINGFLEGDGDHSGINQQLGALRRDIETLGTLDTRAAVWAEHIVTVQASLHELTTFVNGYGDAPEGDPAQRLDFINARLAKIQRLKKKYQATFEQLMEKTAVLSAELNLLDNSAADRRILADRFNAAHARCLEAAHALTKARHAAGALFDRAVSQYMNRLGFADGSWRTVFTTHETLDAHGLEAVSIDVRTNPGEPYMPLVKTASGGEISRLMLAVKSVMATQDRIPVLIFDEIDTGIGGIVASAVANALVELAQSHQVLCITHLHQIAAAAPHHLRVTKETVNGRTVSTVTVLDETLRVDEIARMLGADSVAGRKHAADLVRKKTSSYNSGN